MWKKSTESDRIAELEFELERQRAQRARELEKIHARHRDIFEALLLENEALHILLQKERENHGNDLP